MKSNGQMERSSDVCKTEQLPVRDDAILVVPTDIGRLSINQPSQEDKRQQQI